MRLLQSGVAKSGNYWLWQILQQIFKEASLPNETFIQKQAIYQIAKDWGLSYEEQAGVDTVDITPDAVFYRISTIFRMPIEDIDSYLAQTNHVWTHSEFNKGMAEILPKFDKVVYIIRDPRDVLLSQARFAFTPYFLKYFPKNYVDEARFIKGELKPSTARWMNHVGLHLQNREVFNIHVMFYENLLNNFDDELTQLLQYLEIDLTDAACDRIKHATQFETMKQANPNHVQKGQAYKWMEKLKPEQKEQANQVADCLLELLGYPTTLEAKTLPNLDKARPELIAQCLAEKPKQSFATRVMRRAANVIGKKL